MGLFYYLHLDCHLSKLSSSLVFATFSIGVSVYHLPSGITNSNSKSVPLNRSLHPGTLEEYPQVPHRLLAITNQCQLLQ